MAPKRHTRRGAVMTRPEQPSRHAFFSTLAAFKLSSLYPTIGPWTSAALWYQATADRLPNRAQNYPDLSLELDALYEQRLSPLAVRCAAAIFGPTAVDRRLRADSFAWIERSLGTVRCGSEVLALLYRAGVPHVVSKGPGVAVRYPQLTDRPFSDLDIIVPVRDFSKAASIAARAGYRENALSQQPWRFFDRWCREAVNLRHPEGGSIDLHHHVPPWVWGERLSFAGIFQRSKFCRVFAVDMPVASVEDNLLIAALHVVSDKNEPGRTLLIWRDLVELARAAKPEAAAELALHTGLAGWLLAVLRALPLNVQPHSLMSLLSPHPAILRPARVTLLLSATVARVGVGLSQPLRLPLASSAAYVAGMLFTPKILTHPQTKPSRPRTPPN